MKKDLSPLRILCPETVLAANPFSVLVEFDFAHSTTVCSLSGVFEGKSRTWLSNQNERRVISTVCVDFDRLLQQWRTPTGKTRAPAGHYHFETRMVVDRHCPGTFSGKYGAIEYAVIVKMQMAGRIARSEALQVRAVQVVPVVDVSRFLAFRAPVTLHKNFRRKVFCFNKTNTRVVIRLDKAAFVRGEKLCVSGEVINEHPSNTVKGGIIELVMLVNYTCKATEKSAPVIVAHFAVSAVAPQSISAFEHALQIPADAFPTYNFEGSLVRASYYLQVSIQGCSTFEIPMVVGTGEPTTPMRPTSLAITATPARVIPTSKDDRERPAAHPLPYLSFPPPPYTCPPFTGPPLAAEFMVPTAPFATAGGPNWFCKPSFRAPTTLYNGQSVLKIEEIE